jgi:hypothetical protein
MRKENVELVEPPVEARGGLSLPVLIALGISTLAVVALCIAAFTGVRQF